VCACAFYCIVKVLCDNTITVAGSVQQQNEMLDEPYDVHEPEDDMQEDGAQSAVDSAEEEEEDEESLPYNILFEKGGHQPTPQKPRTGMVF